MASRNLGDLSMQMQILFNRFNDRVRRDPWMQQNGVTLLVTCTYRSPEEQARLYAQGRTLPGRIVTRLKAGKSRHNAQTPQGLPAAEAVDIVPLRHGRPVWGLSGNGVDEDPSDDDRDDLEVWQRCGQHGVDVGLVWGGNWTSFKDYPHFELP